MLNRQRQRQRNHGFTLLELLVVLAILVVVAGAVIASYDGLVTRAAQGQATYNIAALDSSIRVHRTLNNGQFADNWDSLLVGDGTTGEALNLLNTKILGKIGTHALTDEGVLALNEVGITELRYITDASYDNADPDAGGTQPSIPNRVFDEPTRGFGGSVALATGNLVAAIESKGVVTAFSDGAAPTDSSRLRDIAGLDDSVGHIVVVVGIGNNATIVGGENGSLAQAPYYKNVAPEQYGRFLALFHIGTDTDDSGSVDAGEYFSSARFLGVIDTKGDWYEEEEAEYTGVKK